MVPFGRNTCLLACLFGLFSVFIAGCSEYRFKTLVAPVFYGFENNTQGWRVDDGGIGRYSETGGNPNGCVYGSDNSTGAWFFLAPKSLLQEIQKGYGKTIRFELKLNVVGTAKTTDDVILTDGISTITYDSDHNPGTTWTNYSVTLDEFSGWKMNSARATQADIKRILQHVTELKIRGEFLEGPDCGALDNVALN